MLYTIVGILILLWLLGFSMQCGQRFDSCPAGHRVCHICFQFAHRLSLFGLTSKLGCGNVVTGRELPHP